MAKTVVDDNFKQLEDDFADTCHKLGGKFHMTELVGGVDMFCHLKDMEINYTYEPKDISVISVSSNKKVINNIPEMMIEISEPNIVDYYEDRSGGGLVIKSREIGLFLSKQGWLHVSDEPLNKYREIQAQY